MSEKRKAYLQYACGCGCLVNHRGGPTAHLPVPMDMIPKDWTVMIQDPSDPHVIVACFHRVGDTNIYLEKTSVRQQAEGTVLERAMHVRAADNLTPGTDIQVPMTGHDCRLMRRLGYLPWCLYLRGKDLEARPGPWRLD